MSVIEAVTALIPTVVNWSSARWRGGREAEGGGLLSFPRLTGFNLPNNLQMGAGAPKWGDYASFGCICSPETRH
jgi:hypothetical protein